MASAVLADPHTCSTMDKPGRRPAMEKSENDAGDLEQFLLHSTLIWLSTTVDAVADVPVLKGVPGRALGFKICFCKVSEMVCVEQLLPMPGFVSLNESLWDPTSACHTILRSSLLVVFLFAQTRFSVHAYLLVSTAPNNF
ncbi:hypothetical protein TNCV_1908691 [Trichonephila clavipes]|nr:hypothetical protein TNCV_1908691 [Trichonephila clavipes]